MSCRALSSSILFLASATLVGCSSYGTVNGKVTLRGKPVIMGSVTAVASDNLPYAAMINPDGTYSLLKVPTGPIKFAVTSPNPGGSMRSGSNTRVGGDASGGPKVAAVGWFALPEKYDDPHKSGLIGVVKSPSSKIDLTMD